MSGSIREPVRSTRRLDVCQKKPGTMPTDLPDDVAQALAAAPEARPAFCRLPPSHQSEYLKWVGEAKRPETRRKRIAGMIERLNSKDAR